MVSSGTDIPGLGNKLDVGNDRILLDDIEEGRELVNFRELAGKRGGQVEPETVNMHFGDPVPQRIHDQLKGMGGAHKQGIPGPRSVEIVAFIAVNEAVVRPVVDPLEAQRGAHIIAFRCVVINHVKDDLNTCVMVCPHHGLELIDLLAALSGA